MLTGRWLWCDRTLAAGSGQFIYQETAFGATGRWSGQVTGR